MTSGPQRIHPDEMARRAQQRQLLEGQETEVLAEVYEILAEWGAALAQGRGTAAHYQAGLQRQMALHEDPLIARAAGLALRLLPAAEIGSSGVQDEDLVVALGGVQQELNLPHRVAERVRITLSRDSEPPRFVGAVLGLGAPVEERSDQPLAANAPWSQEIERWLSDPPAHARGPDFEISLTRWREAWGRLIELARTNATRLLFSADADVREGQYRKFGQRLEALWRARVGEPVVSADPESPEALQGTEEEILNTIADMVDHCYTGWDGRIRQLEQRTPTVAGAARCSSMALEGIRVAQRFGRRVAENESCPRLVRRTNLPDGFEADVHVQEAAVAACDLLFSMGIAPHSLPGDLYRELFEEILEDPVAQVEILWGPLESGVSQLLEMVRARYRTMTPEERSEVFEGFLDCYQEAVKQDPSIRVDQGAEAEALHTLGLEIAECNRMPFDPKHPELRTQRLGPLLRTLQHRFGLQSAIEISAARAAEAALCAIHPEISSRLRLMQVRAASKGAPLPSSELAEQLRADMASRVLSKVAQEARDLRSRLDVGMARLAELESPEGKQRHDEALRRDVEAMTAEWSSLEARYQSMLVEQLLRNEEGLTPFGARIWMSILGVGELGEGPDAVGAFLGWCRRARAAVLQRSVQEPWRRLFSPEIEECFLSNPPLLNSLMRKGISAEALAVMRVRDFQLVGPEAVSLEDAASVDELGGEALDQTVGALMLEMVDEGELTLDQIVLEGERVRGRLAWSLTNGRLLLRAMRGEFELVHLLRLSDAQMNALQGALGQAAVRGFLKRLLRLEQEGVEVIDLATLQTLLRDLGELSPDAVALVAGRLYNIIFFRLLLSGDLSMRQIAELTPEQTRQIGQLDATLVDMVAERHMTLERALEIDARGADRFFQVRDLPAVQAINGLPCRLATIELLTDMPEEDFNRVRLRLGEPESAALLEAGPPARVLELLGEMSEQAFAALQGALNGQDRGDFVTRLFALPDLELAQLEQILGERLAGFVRLMGQMTYLAAPRLLVAMVERPDLMRQMLLLPPELWPELEELGHSGLWPFVARALLSVERVLGMDEEEKRVALELVHNLTLQEILQRALWAGNQADPIPTMWTLLGRLLQLPFADQQELLELLQDQPLVELLLQTGDFPEAYLGMEPAALGALRECWATYCGAQLLLQHRDLRQLCLTCDTAALDRFLTRLLDPRDAVVYAASQMGVVHPQLYLTLSDEAFQQLTERLNHGAIQDLMGEVPLGGRRDPFLDGLAELTAEQFSALVDRLQRAGQIEALARSTLSLQEFLASEL